MVIQQEVQVDQVGQAVQADKTIHDNNSSNWEMLHVNHQTQVDLLTSLELE